MTAAEDAAEVRAVAWILRATKRGGAPSTPAKTETGTPNETARNDVPTRKY